MIKENINIIKTQNQGTSLVVRWLTIRLPMQGAWVQSLVQKDPICHTATKPVHHNYGSPVEPVVGNKRSHRSEKPTHLS